MSVLLDARLREVQEHPFRMRYAEEGWSNTLIKEHLLWIVYHILYAYKLTYYKIDKAEAVLNYAWSPSKYRKKVFLYHG